MKSKDLQNIVLSKYRNGETPTMIFHHLNNSVSLRTIERWCKLIRETGDINLSKPPGCPRIVRTKSMIHKVKNRLKRKKRISCRKLAKELDISERSVRRILKHDLGCLPYKKRIEPKLTDEQKLKRVKFSNWVRHHFKKEETMKILFTDEKIFDLNGIYNSQNDRIWAVSRSDADQTVGIKSIQKFRIKVMVWLGVCSQGVTPLIIIESGTIDHQRYIEKILPVAKEFGDKVLGTQWTFQQDGARPHTHRLSQQWCKDHFPSFIDKDRWPANSPDLNPMDYSIWDELAQQMKWNKIKSKKTLITELKQAVKRIRKEVVLESCSSWTNRLYRLSQENGNYLH